MDRISQIYADARKRKRQSKEKDGDRWKLAKAAASNRFLLIGNSGMFGNPGGLIEFKTAGKKK